MTKQRIIFSSLIILALLFLQSCTPSNLSINSYRTIGASLKKSYGISRGNLIATYDLGKIDNTSCIYSNDLGFIINNKYYTSKYIQIFKEKFNSPNILKKEAKNKIIRIYKLLLKLHSKHRILSKNQYQYIKNYQKKIFEK